MVLIPPLSGLPKNGGVGETAVKEITYILDKIYSRLSNGRCYGEGGLTVQCVYSRPGDNSPIS